MPRRWRKVHGNGKNSWNIIPSLMKKKGLLKCLDAGPKVKVMTKNSWNIIP